MPLIKLVMVPARLCVAGGQPLNSSVRLLLVMKRMSILLAITALTSISTGRVVSASQCKSLTPFAEEFNKSKVVFAGTVIEITKPRPDEYVERGQVIYEDRLYVYVTFVVKRSWKGVGKGERVITVEAEREAFGCGKDFRVGDAYLVYARGSGGWENERLWIDCCTRSGRIEEAGGDVQKLGAMKSRRGVRRRG